MLIRIARWIVNAISSLLTRREVSGLERMSQEVPYILVVNHLSFFDVPFLFGLIGHDRMTGWVAEKYERHLLFGPIIKLGNGVFIRRGEVDRAAFQSAAAWLKAGNIFGVAPEGTRSSTGSLIRAKTGAAYLADEAQAPILPLAITGTETTLRSWRRLRRPVFTLRVGELFHLPPLNKNDRIPSLRKNTDEVMCQIAALLPPEYRGVYKDHPRLKELLADRNNLES